LESLRLLGVFLDHLALIIPQNQHQNANRSCG